jgi:transcriptional regulator with XRE-family HTH domain
MAKGFRFQYCDKCNGTGKIALTSEFRRARQDAGLSLRTVATALKISAAYLSDIERGNRQPSVVLTEQFYAVLEARR